ncbi:MAG: DUF4034 domain-containing protein [Pirellulales bacterium]
MMRMLGFWILVACCGISTATADDEPDNPIRPDFWYWTPAQAPYVRAAIPNSGIRPQPPERRPFAPPPRRVLRPIDAPKSVRVDSLAEPIGISTEDALRDPPPAYLSGGTVVTMLRPQRPARPPQATPLRDGTLTFETLADGPLFIAAPYAPDNPLYPRAADEQSLRQIMRAGWMYAGETYFVSQLQNSTTPWLLFFRECKRGEKFDLKTFKGLTPRVIVPDAGRLPAFEALEPDPKLREPVQRRFIASKMERLLVEGRYEELERWAQSYLQNDAQFPSGASKFSELRGALGFTEHDVADPAEVDRYLEQLQAWLAKYPDSAAAKLTLAALYSETVELSGRYAKSPAEQDDARRRALELVYETEQAGCRSPDLYRTALRMGYYERRDEDLVDAYVERVLKSGKWAPSALTAAYLHYSRLYRKESEGKRMHRVQAFFKQLLAETQDKYGPAMFAAMVEEIEFRPQDAGIAGAGIDWPTLQAGFEALRKRFPDSPQHVQHYARWACLFGDRATAKRLFDELGELRYEAEDRVWYDSLDLYYRRHWASDNFAHGDQTLLFDHPANGLYFASWYRGDDLILFCDRDGVAGVINPQTGERTRWGRGTSQLPYRNPGAFDYRPAQGMLGIGTRYGNIARLNLPEQQRRWAIVDLKATIAAVTLTDDFQYAVGSDGKGRFHVVYMRDEWDGLPRTVPTNRKKPEILLRFLDADTLLGVNFDCTVTFWNYPELTEKRTWKAAGRFTETALLSPDRKRLATVAEDGITRIYSLDDGTEIVQCPKGRYTPWCLSFSPDGRYLAAGESVIGNIPTALRLFEVESGKLVKEFLGHMGQINSLAFSPDGKRLLSAGSDHSLRIWSVP